MCSDKVIAALAYNPLQPWPLGDDLMPTDRQWHTRRPRPFLDHTIDQIRKRLYHYPQHESRTSSGGAAFATHHV